MTITEFLLARIAEDEDRANGTGSKALADPRWAEYPGAIYDAFRDVAITFAHRTLAECQAKRAIIEEHHSEVGYLVAYRESDRLIAEGYDLDAVPFQASATMAPACLRHLAAVYADHPDYRQEWRP